MNTTYPSGNTNNPRRRDEIDSEASQRREAIILQAAQILALVPKSDKPKAANLLDDLVYRAMEHGNKVARDVLLEAMA
jgi:hypothetical protein